MTTIKKLEELIYKGFKETDARIDERWKRLERLYQKTANEHKILTKELGGVTESLSRFSEQTVFSCHQATVQQTRH